MHRLRREQSGTVVIAKEKISFQELVGRGGFGAVHRAEHTDWGEVAVKVFSEAEEILDKEKKKLVAEAEKMWELSHTNITRIFGIIMERKKYGIVLEYMRHGSLSDFIEEYDIPFAIKAQIIYQIILGMNYLHTREPAVLHLDLKGMNVLVSNNFDAKICDFGLAQWRSFSERYSVLKQAKMCGTASHIPPERWLNINEKPSEKFDVYSFGILLWEILTENQPFKGIESMQISTAVARGQRPDTSELPHDTPPLIQEILLLSWNQNPEKRPSFGGLKNSFEDFYKKRYYGDIPEAKILLIRQVKEKSDTQQKTQMSGRIAQENAGQLESEGQGQPVINTDNSGTGTGTLNRVLGALSTVEVDGPQTDVSQNDDQKMWNASGFTVPKDPREACLKDQSNLKKAERNMSYNPDMPVQPTDDLKKNDAQAYGGQPQSAVNANISNAMTNTDLPVQPESAQCDLEVDGYQTNVASVPSMKHTTIPVQRNTTETISHSIHTPSDADREEIHMPMQRATETQEFTADLSADLRLRLGNLDSMPNQKTQSEDNGFKNQRTSPRNHTSSPPNRNSSPNNNTSPSRKNENQTRHRSDIETDGEPISPPNTDPYNSGSYREPPRSHDFFNTGMPFFQRFPNQYVPAPGGHYFYPAPNMSPVFIPTVAGASSMPPGFPPPPQMQGATGGLDDPKVNYSSGDKKPNIIKHKHSSGGTTTIFNLSQMDGIQIGDKNVMYIGTKPHKSRKGKIIKAKITESKRTVTVQDIEIVSEHLGSFWKKLARKIGFSEGQIDAVDADYHINGLREKIYQMLVQWRTREGRKANAKTLADHLCDMGKADIAAMLEP